MTNFNYDKLSRKSGYTFENWFSRLMKEKYSTRFIQTKNAGKGDYKVDCVLDLNTCFACYGAQNSQSFDRNSPQKFAKDLKKFYKIKKYKWPTMKNWVFVTNSQHEELPADLVSKKLKLLKELDIDFNCSIWTLYDIDNKINNQKIVLSKNEDIIKLCNKLLIFLMEYKRLRIDFQDYGYESNFYYKLDIELKISNLESEKEILKNYNIFFRELKLLINENLIFLNSIGLREKIQEFFNKFKITYTSDIYTSFVNSFSKITTISIKQEEEFINSIIEKIQRNIQ